MATGRPAAEILLPNLPSLNKFGFFAVVEVVDAAASRYNSSVHEDFYFVIMEPYVYTCMY